MNCARHRVKNDDVGTLEIVVRQPFVPVLFRSEFCREFTQATPVNVVVEIHVHAQNQVCIHILVTVPLTKFAAVTQELDNGRSRGDDQQRRWDSVGASDRDHHSMPVSGCYRCASLIIFSICLTDSASDS